MMQAMIFAAGMGTRLKPLTDVMPKAMVPVGDRPLLQIVMPSFALAILSQRKVGPTGLLSEHGRMVSIMWLSYVVL